MAGNIEVKMQGSTCEGAKIHDFLFRKVRNQYCLKDWPFLLKLCSLHGGCGMKWNLENE